MKVVKRWPPVRYIHELAYQKQSDAELLRRYAESRDEEAFAELVRRAGPQVLRTCRHVLGEATAAEDAFQATFLLLARKAARIASSAAVAGWLHKTALHVAHDARRAETRRRRHELASADVAKATVEEPSWREVRERLDTELAALPEKYRTPLVLCYLQDLTYEQAALRTGCTVGALRGRLERGKELLRSRLAKCGLTLGAPVLVMGKPAAVTATLVQTTLATVRTGQAGGVIAPAIAALLGGSTWIKGVVYSLAVVIALVSAWALAGQDQQQSPEKSTPQPAAEQPPPPKTKTDLLGDPLPPGAVARLGTRRFQTQPMAQRTTAAPNVNALFFDDYFAAMGGERLRQIDGDTGKERGAWPIPQGQYVAGVSPDGRWAVFANRPNTGWADITNRPGHDDRPDRAAYFILDLHDLTGKLPMRQLWARLEPLKRPNPNPHTSDKVVSCFSHDGKWLLMMQFDQDSRLRLWDVETAKQLWEAPAGPGFDAAGWPLGTTADKSQWIFLTNQGKQVTFFDLATKKVVRQFPIEGAGACQMSPDRSTLIRFTRLLPGEEIQFWDLKTGKQLPRLTGHKEGAISATFTPSGKTLITGDKQGEVVVRDWPAGKIQRRFDLDRTDPTAFLSLSERTLTVFFGRESMLHRYDLVTGKPLPMPAESHRGMVNSVVAGSKDTVVSMGNDHVFRTWDVSTGRQTKHEHLGSLWQNQPFALSPDRRWIATGVVEGDRPAVTLFDRETAKPVRRFVSEDKQNLNRILFSPDGRLLVTSNERLGVGTEGYRVQIWDTATGKQVKELPRGAQAGSFSPDGQRFVSIMPEGLSLWTVPGWKHLDDLPGTYVDVGFSPDGRMIAAADFPSWVKIWEVATRKVRLQLPLPGPRHNFKLQFASDSRLLAVANTGSAEVSVWDLLSHQQPARFVGHDSAINALVFTEDGRRLVTASSDSTLLVWDVTNIIGREKHAGPETDKEWDVAWKELGSEDAQAAFGALRKMAASPAKSVTLIRMHIKPVAAKDLTGVPKLLNDLDSEAFATRQRAFKQLQAFGDHVEGSLRTFLAANPSDEARRRAEQLLAAFSGPVTDPNRLREIRAIEILERTGTQEARGLLRELAGGAPVARLTREAAAALKRLPGE